MVKDIRYVRLAADEQAGIIFGKDNDGSIEDQYLGG